MCFIMCVYITLSNFILKMFHSKVKISKKVIMSVNFFYFILLNIRNIIIP